MGIEQRRRRPRPSNAGLDYPEIRDRHILLDGWLKTYAMTGWRLGYSVWPKPWRDVARKLAVNSIPAYASPNCGALAASKVGFRNTLWLPDAGGD